MFRRHPKLTVLIHKENHDWIAHCLEFDMVGISPISAKSAVDELIDLMKVQISFAVKNNSIENLFTLAPKELWIKKTFAKKCSYRKLKELNNIDVVNDQPLPNGIELCYA